jgi:hypothetical protein
MYAHVGDELFIHCAEPIPTGRTRQIMPPPVQGPRPTPDVCVCVYVRARASHAYSSSYRYVYIYKFYIYIYMYVYIHTYCAARLRRRGPRHQRQAGPPPRVTRPGRPGPDGPTRIVTCMARLGWQAKLTRGGSAGRPTRMGPGAWARAELEAGPFLPARVKAIDTDSDDETDSDAPPL